MRCIRQNRFGAALGSLFVCVVLSACGPASGDATPDIKIDNKTAVFTYPEAMPPWMSQGLEMCRIHQLSEGDTANTIATLAETYGWTPANSIGATGQLNNTDQYTADKGRYLYHLYAISMAYGTETVLKCQIMQMPEPFRDPLPEGDFTAIGRVVGIDGAFERFKPCQECDEALLGQWAWTVGDTRLLISAQADISTTISILFTNS